jgi:hypothetical protein
MTFLNPAILFGLLAATVPILLHFLNLKKLKRVEFSSLAFLKQLQKTKIRRIKLKQWLLLLLRFLIIILLVSAFARPTIDSAQFGKSTAAKTTAVLIIDNTFSMSELTDDGSKLNRAKQAAEKLLRLFNKGDEIAIVTVGNPHAAPRPVSDIGMIKNDIKNIEISYTSSSINNALIKAAQILYESDNFNKEIFLFSDSQKGSLYSNESDLANLGEILNENVRLYNFNFSGQSSFNAGIENLICSNQIFQRDKKIGFTARVNNYSDSRIDNSVISLFINGKRKAQQSFSLSPEESKNILLETTLADTGLIEIQTQLEDDAILHDNKRETAISVPSKINVLLAADNPKDNQFIDLALNSNNGGLLNISKIKTAQLNSVNLTNYHAVIISGAIAPDYREKLRSHILAGGKITFIPGSDKNGLFSQMLREFGIQSDVKFIETSSGGSAQSIDKVLFEHPLFSDLFDRPANNKFDSPEIFKYYKYAAPADSRSVISLSDGTPFLLEKKSGTGSIILFSSAMDLSWNTFPLKSLFAPTINRIVLYSSSKLKPESDNFCGGQILIDLSGKKTSQIKVVTPSNNINYISTDSLINKNYFFFNAASEPGIYKFYSADKLIDFASVNHDPRESITDTYDTDELESFLKKTGSRSPLRAISDRDDFIRAVYESRFGTELWSYLLIAALILMIIEMFVSKSSKKEMSDLIQ